MATVPGLRTYTETVHLNVDCKLLLAAQTPLRYCAVLLCPDRVCLSVYVCPSANMSPELQVRSSLDLIFVHVTGGRGSVLLWQRCEILCTSGFMDDVNVYTGPGAESDIYNKSKAYN